MSPSTSPSKGSQILQTKRKGIHAEGIKPCGCKVKSYVGGMVVIEGCTKHKTEIYYVCPSCGKEYHGRGGKRNNGKKEMKKCVWSHAQ